MTADQMNTAAADPVRQANTPDEAPADRAETGSQRIAHACQ